MNAFHSTNLFCCFSRYQAPANSVAPPYVYKPHTQPTIRRFTPTKGYRSKRQLSNLFTVANLHCQLSW